MAKARRKFTVWSNPAAASSPTPCPTAPAGGAPVAACVPVTNPIAAPPLPQHYILPGSQYADPPYSWQASSTWPYPRAPWPYETETRAAGTGLIWGCPTGSGGSGPPSGIPAACPPIPTA